MVTSNQQAQTQVTLPRLMDQKELAAYTGKPVSWFENARWRGEGPPYLKLGRNVRYKAEDVEKWISESYAQGGQK